MLLIAATLPFHLLDWLAHLMGIAYPPDLLLLAAVLFSFVLQFHLTMALSRISEQVTKLAQMLAISRIEGDGSGNNPAHYRSNPD